MEMDKFHPEMYRYKCAKEYAGNVLWGGRLFLKCVKEFEFLLLAPINTGTCVSSLNACNNWLRFFSQLDLPTLFRIIQQNVIKKNYGVIYFRCSDYFVVRFLNIYKIFALKRWFILIVEKIALAFLINDFFHASNDTWNA